MIDWLNDPMLKNMDPIKVELIKTAAAQTSGKSGRALAPVLMTLITNANKKGIGKGRMGEWKKKATDEKYSKNGRILNEDTSLACVLI